MSFGDTTAIDSMRRRLESIGRSLLDNWRKVIPTGLWLVGTLLLSLALALCHSPLVPLPGVVAILLIPGASVMSTLRARPSSTPGRLVLAVCLSMVVVMVVGGVASLVGPVLGVAQPLDALPQSLIWFAIALAVLIIGVQKQDDPATWIFEGVRASQVYGALACGFLVVPALLGVAQLNYSGDNHLAVCSTVLDVAVLLVGIVGGWRRNNRWPLNAILYAASLSLLLSTSLRGAHLYGWDIQQEFGDAWNTAHAGVWAIPANHDPYASMLSLTVLPAILHSLVKLRLLAFFQLVVPAILALLPLAVFSTIRVVPRWITSGRSAPRPGLAFAVVVGVIVSSVAFSSELVSITRQAMALTLVTSLVMVLFDRTMLKRQSQVIIGIFLVAISFTHYTTSYLLAVIFLCAWCVSIFWSRGWLGTPRAKRKEHEYHARSRKIINVILVLVAFAAAFGWNLGITRNYALSAPSSAVTTKGAGLAAASNSVFLTPEKFERILVGELEQTARWIVPIRGAGAVRLESAPEPSSPALVPSLSSSWNEIVLYAQESLWIVLGIALLYGLFRLGRRRSYQYSADMVGLAVAGLMIGGFLRFSGTLAAYYNPERAAIFTAILLAAPVTLFLDDTVTFLYRVSPIRNRRVSLVSLGAGFAFVAVLVVQATGLGALLVGGQAPGSLSAHDVNVDDFTVSTPELATADWLRNKVIYPNIVQSDLYGHLVLLSAPGSYSLQDQIVPPEVDKGSYIYLSSVNLAGLSQAEADNGVYLASYRSTIRFFNQHFYVVYSTGATRVYH